jgi:hypothetical protein
LIQHSLKITQIYYSIHNITYSSPLDYLPPRHHLFKLLTLPSNTMTAERTVSSQTIKTTLLGTNHQLKPSLNLMEPKQEPLVMV